PGFDPSKSPAGQRSRAGLYIILTGPSQLGPHFWTGRPGPPILPLLPVSQ
ncbi:hypothetical protein PanWU01x14_037460, partial [Parasponia andersonii]